MSIHHYYIGDAGTAVEITDQVRRGSWEYKEAAEEGSVPISSVIVDDSSLAFEVLGHREWYAIEDAAGTENRIFDGFVADQKITRGEIKGARQWELSVADLNSLIFKRVMTGSDCNRPIETDVARMTWLYGTDEAHAFYSTTNLSTASPVSMDAADYRGQQLSQVIDDCAQSSGKNWYLQYSVAAGKRLLWYGSADLSTYTSTLSLSNDPADLDTDAMSAGTAAVWPISEDTSLTRDPSRVFSGLYADIDGGATYRRRNSTETAFTWRRDARQSWPNVKTIPTAQARADAQLAYLKDQEHTITTSVTLPASLVHAIRPGMLIDVKATHLPNYDVAVSCRVLTRAIKQFGLDAYTLTLELAPVTVPNPVACSTSLATRVEADLSLQTYALHLITIPITPVADASLIFSLCLAANGNTPHDVDVVGTGAYTTLYSSDAASLGPGFGVLYAANHAAGATNVTASYTPGYSPTDASTWGGVAVAIATTATSPVQSKSATSASPLAVTLDSTPTPGNILLMAIGFRSASTPSLTTGGKTWTLVGTATAGYAPGVGTVWIYASCVNQGDTTGPYGDVNGVNQIVSVSEWTIS